MALMKVAILIRVLIRTILIKVFLAVAGLVIFLRALAVLWTQVGASVKVVLVIFLGAQVVLAVLLIQVGVLKKVVLAIFLHVLARVLRIQIRDFLAVVFILTIVRHGTSQSALRMFGLLDRLIRIGELMPRLIRLTILRTFLVLLKVELKVKHRIIRFHRSMDISLLLMRLQELSGLRFRQMHLLASTPS
jgi:hypothetical protein